MDRILDERVIKEVFGGKPPFTDFSPSQHDYDAVLTAQEMKDRFGFDFKFGVNVVDGHFIGRTFQIFKHADKPPVFSGSAASGVLAHFPAVVAQKCLDAKKYHEKP